MIYRLHYNIKFPVLEGSFPIYIELYINFSVFLLFLPPEGVLFRGPAAKKRARISAPSRRKAPEKAPSPAGPGEGRGKRLPEKPPKPPKIEKSPLLPVGGQGGRFRGRARRGRAVLSSFVPALFASRGLFFTLPGAFCGGRAFRSGSARARPPPRTGGSCRR